MLCLFIDCRLLLLGFSLFDLLFFGLLPGFIEDSLQPRLVRRPEALLAVQIGIDFRVRVLRHYAAIVVRLWLVLVAGQTVGRHLPFLAQLLNLRQCFVSELKLFLI